MLALVVTSGPQQGLRAEVTEQISIGREGQDLLLDDAEVSRSHAVVRPAGTGLEIEDVGSSNGTWVNGRRITGPTRLLEGDEVVLGQTYLRAEASTQDTVAGSPAGGTVVAPQDPGAPQDPSASQAPPAGEPMRISSTPGSQTYESAPADPSHTAPMQTYSYDSGPPEPIEGPKRSLWVWIVPLVVLLVAVGVALFLILGRGPSKEDTIAEADAICADASEQADAIEQPVDVSLEESADYFGQIAGITREEVTKLEALEAPEEDRDVFNEFIGTQEDLAEQFDELAAAAEAGDQDAFDGVLADATTSQSRASELAQDYGFENCGKSTPGE